MQTIDPLHSINMLNICAYLQQVEHLKDLVDQKSNYIIDSNDGSPSDNLMKFNNYQGISVLFQLIDEVEQPYLDETTFYYRMKHDVTWITEHENFQQPKSLKAFKNPLYGILKNGES
jgi:hypothetical protein